MFISKYIVSIIVIVVIIITIYFVKSTINITDLGHTQSSITGLPLTITADYEKLSNCKGYARQLKVVPSEPARWAWQSVVIFASPSTVMLPNCLYVNASRVGILQDMQSVHNLCKRTSK